MRGQLKKLKNSYYGIVVDPCLLEKFKSELYKHLTEDEFLLFVNNRLNRDGENYHITVFTPKESRQIKLQEKELIDYDFEFVGLGTVQNENNKAYYVVIESDELQKLRLEHGLNHKDFHITLGFSEKDVHNVIKTANLLKG